MHAAAGHRIRPRTAVTRSAFPIVSDDDRRYFGLADERHEPAADCRPGISAARHLYAGIGHEVAFRGGNSIASRAVVPRSRKARLLGRSLVAAAAGRCSGTAHPPLEATRFLVEAVAASVAAEETPAQSPDQVIWLITLFERLERGQRAALQRHG